MNIEKAEANMNRRLDMHTRRDVLKYGGALVSIPLLERFAFTKTTADTTGKGSREPLGYVNPEFRPTLKALLPLLASTPPVGPSTLAANRATGNHNWLSPLPKPAVIEHSVTGPKGSPDVRVFVIGDSPGASKPAVLHIHGGGYVSGTAAYNQRRLQELANDLDCVVVTVEYRLAPETRFPGSLEDNYAALRWMYANAKELGIDVTRIAVKGESAGGGHAAALAIAVRDRREFSFCQQILIYPMLDDRTGSTGQVPPYIGHFIWTPENNRFGWSSLLGVPAGSDQVPANAVPARVKNLNGLAPAFVGVGSIDLFASEDVDYARRLFEAGIPTELLVVPGAFHAFDAVCPNVPLTVQFKNAWSQTLRRAFKI